MPRTAIALVSFGSALAAALPQLLGNLNGGTGTKSSLSISTGTGVGALGASGLTPAVPSIPALPTGLGSATGLLSGATGVVSAPALPLPLNSIGLSSIPGLPPLPVDPSLPESPAVPGLPSVPSLRPISAVPALSAIPSVPGIGLPSTPGLPSLPGIPLFPSDGSPGAQSLFLLLLNIVLSVFDLVKKGASSISPPSNSLASRSVADVVRRDPQLGGLTSPVPSLVGVNSAVNTAKGLPGVGTAVGTASNPSTSAVAGALNSLPVVGGAAGNLGSLASAAPSNTIAGAPKTPGDVTSVLTSILKTPAFSPLSGLSLGLTTIVFKAITDPSSGLLGSVTSTAGGLTPRDNEFVEFVKRNLLPVAQSIPALPVGALLPVPGLSSGGVLAPGIADGSLLPLVTSLLSGLPISASKLGDVSSITSSLQGALSGGILTIVPNIGPVQNVAPLLSIPALLSTLQPDRFSNLGGLTSLQALLSAVGTLSKGDISLVSGLNLAIPGTLNSGGQFRNLLDFLDFILKSASVAADLRGVVALYLLHSFALA